METTASWDEKNLEQSHDEDAYRQRKDSGKNVFEEQWGDLCKSFEFFEQADAMINKYIIILNMIKKNKRSTSYLNHPLNNSPSKTAVKFGHELRFI